MSETSPPILSPNPSAEVAPKHEVPFGVNEMRLSAREWMVALAIVAICLLVVPKLWTKAEKFETGADYRIPFELSKDYWLYERRLRQIEDKSRVVVLGDSVIWGVYVKPEGAVTHFLGQQSGRADEFVNAGLNGLFPLAMEGLVGHYADALRNRKVIVHCNVLWMTSPKVDLSIEKEQAFEHPRLVPQFGLRIPAYKADATERLSVFVEEHVEASSWVGHLQHDYFDHKSIPDWTLVDDGNAPPNFPNAWKNPLGQITMKVPGEPADDPERGPASARHKSWIESGGSETHFEWVPLETSLQWGAFQRVVQMLRSRGNNLLVIIGPFNEHMIAADQRGIYQGMRKEIAAWLAANQFAHISPETLPSELYADSSHPLTAGYELLAKRLWANPIFQKWFGK